MEDRAKHSADSYTRRRLNIANSSDTAGRNSQWNSQPVDEDEEQEDEEDTDLNGVANESASEGSSSSAAPKFNAYSRDMDEQQPRRVSGLYGSEAGSAKLRNPTGGLNFAAHLQGHKSLFPRHPMHLASIRSTPHPRH